MALYQNFPGDARSGTGRGKRVQAVLQQRLVSGQVAMFSATGGVAVLLRGFDADKDVTLLEVGLAL